MERVNVDYISVVRLHEGRLHYEKMPIKKSEALIESLESMACDEHCTIEHMETAFFCSPLFKYMAEPYYYALTYAEPEAYEANRMVELLEPFSEVKIISFRVFAVEKSIEHFTDSFMDYMNMLDHLVECHRYFYQKLEEDQKTINLRMLS